MERIMIDIEGLSLDPRALILSIGAVNFTDDRPQTTFYVSLDANEQDGKRHVSTDTALWWIKQAMTNPAAAAALFDGTRVPSLAAALIQLSAFVGHGRTEREVWFNGPQFDAVVLATAYNDCRLPIPWNYRQERDCRTLFQLAARNGWDSSRIDTASFTAHNALADAHIQALRTISALKFLGID